MKVVEVMDFFNRRTKGEVVFDVINVVLVVIICFITLYPVWYVLIYSFNNGPDAAMGGIYWWPRKFSMENYKAVFRDKSIINAFGITIMRTLITTPLHVFFTAMVAYSLSKEYLIGRKVYFTLGLITMFFAGGLIPYFILIKNIGLYDSFWVYVIPGIFNFYHLLIFQTFFKEIPKSLEESAKIDGANEFLIFYKIILPLSKPVLATIGLFVGVGNWNDFFSGVMYIKDQNLIPIQTFLYKLVAQTGSQHMMANMPDGISKSSVTSQSIRMATMVVTTLPIVCVYPFLQKYFVKGMMVGAVKG